ncbi:MAG: hypothetical protein AAFV86_01950 [Pseudomonadota bacterium]
MRAAPWTLAGALMLAPAGAPATIATPARAFVEIVIDRCAEQILAGRYPDTGGLTPDPAGGWVSAVVVRLDVAERDGARICQVVEAGAAPGEGQGTADAVFDTVDRWARAAIAEERLVLVSDCPSATEARRLAMGSVEPVRRDLHLVLALSEARDTGRLRALVGESPEPPALSCTEEAT